MIKTNYVRPLISFNICCSSVLVVESISVILRTTLTEYFYLCYRYYLYTFLI